MSTKNTTITENKNIIVSIKACNKTIIIHKNKEIKKIEIVSALHFGDNEFKKIWQFSEEAVDENRIRFNDIIQTIKVRFNLPISIHQNEKRQVDHIDEDFLTLSLAKHSITDSGGFGDVINIARSIV